jgi:class 3 adenylate cyclase/tetratricopeptide (TPR) repeat protein
MLIAWPTGEPMRCSQCGSENPDAKKFCGDCGAPLASRCPKCSSENPAGKRFCGECGSALIGNAQTGAAQSSRAESSALYIRIAPDQTDASLVIEGERKTVTALFADIKGSMELMEDLDPEDARVIIDPALKLMMDAVHRYDGYIVQSTGDGIFALFGAPVAYEDHPQRALYAALRIQDETRRYGDRLRSQGRAPVEIRIGINTGEVVVREVHTGGGHVEYTPIGHTTNLAARLQSLARSSSVVVSPVTEKLVAGYFQLKPLGPVQIKGVTEALNLYEVTGLGPLRTRFQRAAGRGLTKFVGRQREIDAMKHAAEQAKAGHGQIVAAIGEPGVGKSRLFFEFKAISQSGWMVLEALSFSHGKASAYLPVIELLREYFHVTVEDDERRRREKIAGKVLMLERSLEDTLPYIFTLMGIQEGSDPLIQMDPQVRRRRTQEAIKRVLLRESLNQSLIIAFEDLHWIDGETQAFLNVMVDAIASARILLLVNYRPEYRHEWGNRTYYTQLRLDPLGRERSEEMLAALLGGAAELKPLCRLIGERTEGNPFFIEEIVQALFEQGALARNGEVKLVRSMAEIKVPPTVQAVLASRIDRLPADEKELLQTVAIIGREFSHQLVQRVAGCSAAELERMLGDLQSGEFIYEQPAFPDTEYAFKHALTQEVAYNSGLSERRKLLHERAGVAIETINAGRLEDKLEALVHHYGRSNSTAKAFAYMRLAAEQAIRRSHYDEAGAYARGALELLSQVRDDPERMRAELALQLVVSRAGVGQVGYVQTLEKALTRAYELCQQIGSPIETFRVIANLWTRHFIRGDLRKSEELGSQLVEVAGNERNDAHLVEAHSVLGDSLYWQGRFREALTSFDYVVANYRPAMGVLNVHGWDGLALSLAYTGLSMWQLGQADKALPMISKAIERATAIENPTSLGLAHYIGCNLYWLQRDWIALEREAELMMSLSEEQGFPVFSEISRAYWHCASFRQQPTRSRLAEVAETARRLQVFESKVNVPFLLVALAEGYSAIGDTEVGLATIAGALALIEVTCEREREVELYRLKGELLQKREQADAAEAEACIRQAIEIARRQQARMFELRATASLARLLATQNRREEACTMLAEIYNWFTEGFDTVDLTNAKALLDELGN